MVPRNPCLCGCFAGGDAGIVFQERCEWCTCPQTGTQLHELAAEGAAQELRRRLVQQAGKPLPYDACGSTPLHTAATHGQAEAVQLLLAHCKDSGIRVVEHRNAFGLNAFHCAAANPGPGTAETLVTLAASGADIHACTESLDEEFSCCNGDTALHLLAQHSWTGQAAPATLVLLAAGLDPLEPGGYLHTTPLEYACAGGDVEAVKLMLEYAVHTHRYKTEGIDVGHLLCLAVAHSATDVVELLLNPTATFRRILTQQPLPEDPSSVLEGQASCSRAPSEDGAAQSGQVCTADAEECIVQPFQLDRCLRLAITRNDLPACRALVAAGASATYWRCNWRLLQGYNDHLHTLSWRGRFPALHSVEVDYQDAPLTLALRLHHMGIAMWLIKRTNAGYPTVDGLRRTALHYLANAGSPKLLAWLLETRQYNIRDKDGERVINLPDEQQYTALAHAIEAGNARAVSLLCKHGASVHRPVYTVHGRMSIISAALLEEDPGVRADLLYALVKHGAHVAFCDLEVAVHLGWADDLDGLLCLLEEPLEEENAASLLFDAIKRNQAGCAEVLLAHGCNPCATLEVDGKRRSLLKLCFNCNFSLLVDASREEAGRSHGKSRQNALRIMQALVLAGADPAEVLAQVQLFHDRTRQGSLRAVAACLLKPVWMRQQHCLWPLAFKRAVQELLLSAHRSLALMAGDTATAQERPPAAAAALPDHAVQCIVRQLAAVWPVSATARR